MKSTMKFKSVIAASLMAACTIAVASGNSNNNDVTNNYDNRNYGGNTTNAGGLGGAGGAGGHGGTANAGAAALAGAVATGGNATGGNSNATGGSVLGSGNSSNKIDNKNTNSNLNAQGQQQSSNSVSGVKNSGNSASKSNAQQAQSTENANNSKQSVTVEGDTYQAARIPVATAYAAGLTATNGTCFGSASGGAQGAGFGFTIGSTTFDENCDIRYDAIALREAGQTKAAVARLCQKPAMAEAMKAAGTPCFDASVANAKTSATSIAPVAKYEHTDPIVRARLGLPPLK